MTALPLASADGLKALWEVTAGRWPGYAPLRGDERCDVAVVGGGFTGLAAALGGRAADAAYPLTPLRRMPFYLLRQPGAAVAILYYRIKDRVGLPS